MPLDSSSGFGDKQLKVKRPNVLGHGTVGRCAVAGGTRVLLGRGVHSCGDGGSCVPAAGAGGSMRTISRPTLNLLLLLLRASV